MPKKRFPGALDRRGDSFRYRVMQDRRTYSFTLPTTDRREAERLALAKFQALPTLAERRAAGQDDKARFSDLISRYRADVLDVPDTLAPGTKRVYADSLTALERHFITKKGDLTVAGFRKTHIAEFVATRRKAVSNATVARDRRVLHLLFEYALQLDMRADNPVDAAKPKRLHLKVERRNPVILSADEYERLLAACDGHEMLRLFVLVLGETGVRSKSEALWLRVEDVDLTAGTIAVVSGRDGHRTKSGKSRVVGMTPRLVDAMRAHLQASRFVGSPWVFHHRTTQRTHERGARIACLRASFTAAAKRAGLPDELVIHDLRHRRATTWLAAGASPMFVRDALGHAQIATTEIYTHLTGQHVEALRRLG